MRLDAQLPASQQVFSWTCARKVTVKLSLMGYTYSTMYDIGRVRSHQDSKKEQARLKRRGRAEEGKY
ncbi:hypothetical protein ARMGADRAFT_1093433 [Armillaria gallica]|uniref:Uncharacterized protein n=1 Tax=Armillaria gallica TaxID=47427 RepID=A0A2H3CCR1_ARMGA|nr:hypothetical protein ARMGADRAFT_1093438 [Armillaria gallica]PBK79107.1 hypothetical protein ARMGADRAFT_1093433 [Armillaria gallica]